MPRNTSTRKLTREEWLARALEALAQHGEGVLTIDALVRRLGVSRGSFYWHFSGRTEFLRQLVEYWFTTYTEAAARELASYEGTPQERLQRLMEHITVGGLNRYDIPIRAWAARDTVASRIVRKADRFRSDYVQSLFREMGFSGEELEIRTRAFVVYFSAELGLFVKTPKSTRVGQLQQLHSFFTRP